MRPLPVLLAATTIVLAGCMAPGSLDAADAADVAAVALVDPLAAGKLPVAWADYDAGVVPVGGPDADHSGYEYDARLRGRVWYPDVAGEHPLLVFLHGQHGTCGMGDQETVILTFDDCSDDEGINTAYPNHLGYEYLAEHLAGHGYVVASILGYEVNRYNGEGDVGMWARGELILATLDAFRAGADGVPAEAVARADITRVGIMGHSRGGEGVVTAVHVNLARPESERHALGAVVALAPTDFNKRGVPDVPLLALVPYCDGDVSTLHGLRTFDRSRHLDETTAKAQVLVRGTNHNFYNTRWYDDAGVPVYPGDDAAFSIVPSCRLPHDAGGSRWSPADTQAESIVHVGGFLRWQAGGEAGLAPWFTGERGLPEGACPAGPARCDVAVGVSAVLPGAERVLVVEDAEVPTRHARGEVTLDGFDRVEACREYNCSSLLRSSAYALDLAWSSDATMRLAFDADADWSAFDAFSFRVAVPDWDDPSRSGVSVRVEFEDASGATATALASDHSSALARAPDAYAETEYGSLGSAKFALQSVRIPLVALDVDAGNVREVRLVFEGEGRALVTDVLVQAEPEVE